MQANVLQRFNQVDIEVDLGLMGNKLKSMLLRNQRRCQEGMSARKVHVSLKIIILNTMKMTGHLELYGIRSLVG